MCTFCLVGFSKATSCELWRDCYNSQGADFGASQVVSEPRFCRYPRVRSAGRITLPMVVVESSVKTILLKLRWIVLSTSVFYALPLCLSPLTFRVFSRLSYLVQVLGFRVGGRSLAFYPNRYDLWKDLDEKHIDVNVSKHSLLVVSIRNLLLVVSTASTRCKNIR
jgi:hypothetical protein